MKKKLALFLCLFGCLGTPASVHAQEEPEDTLFVLKKDGTIDIYPASTLQSRHVVGDNLRLTTLGGEVIRYALADLESYDHQLHIVRPTLTSFKFNNKFNHQLFQDVDCEFTDDHQITGRIAAVGHWLTPSFKRSDNRAEVYLDEKDLMVSKHSRLKFGDEHTITVAFPGIRVLRNVVVSPESDEEGETTSEERMVPFGTEYALKLDWVAYKDVPRVYIDIYDDWDFVPATKYYYINAEITIDGADFYPSMETTPVLIKGRGNSSWSSNPYSKNPYRLKFEDKQKPFGLKAGKNWVLLSNRKTGSMTTNAIGMFAAGIIGSDGANHIIPVELYLNGLYWGSYNFTEKVGLANNSIDLDDESMACRIELDTYTDEQIYRSTPYSLPVKIKDPDFIFDDPEIETTDIMKRFNAFTTLVRQGADLSPEVDVESMARFLVVDELILNYELMHPKSTFLYHENVLEDTCKWKWGPVWDLDWCYGYENSQSYFQGGKSDKYFTRQTNMEAYQFIKKMRQCGESLDRAMYKYWTRFMRLHLDELIDYCDDYYAFAKPSLENNKNAWHGDVRDNTNYAKTTENAKKWLQQRATAAYAQLTPYDDMTEEEILGIPDNDDPNNDSPYYTDQISTPRQPARFTVYDLRGVMLKSNALYNTWREGLAPGIYIVNGKKVLVQ